ncbi:hypothetical protein D9M70_433230 [compost metagenome]
MVDEQRDHRATGSHHVAVTGRADHRTAFGNDAGLGDHELFRHCLGNTHGVDRVNGLVGGKHHHTLHAGSDGSIEDVLGADDVGLDRFHRIELAGRHLLQCRRMEDVVHADHGIRQAVVIAYVSNEELDLVIGQRNAHIFLLLLIATENPDLLDLSIKEAFQYGITEGAGAPGNHQNLIVKHESNPN